jgi:hypothetical protein
MLVFTGATFAVLLMNPSQGRLEQEPDHERLRKVLAILRPKACPFPLLRIGGAADGAYLLPDDLHGIQACFSPGVSDRKGFEDQLAMEYGMASHLCDGSSTVERLRTPLMQGLQTFRKLWLDLPGTPDSQTLDSWVRELAPDTTADLLLQMDIEGAEYRNLLATIPETLLRFRIMVIEFHGLTRLAESDFLRNTALPLFQQIDRDFVCVHAHPNNYDKRNQYIVAEGEETLIPDTLELTFLRRDRLEFSGSQPTVEVMLPHPLDISNAGHRKPLFLDRSWQPDHKRHLLSRWRMIKDYCRWLLRRTKEYD